jgi:hypothetical protein
MNIGEIKADEFLRGKGLRPERFSKKEVGATQTPDYRVFDNQGFAFFCEVKTVAYDDWLERQFKAAPEEELVGGVRNDPAFNRLTNHIHKATKQFNAVNPDLEHLNVLIFFNDDLHTGFLELVGVITGCCLTEGEMVPIYRAFSEGRIREDKYRIHLYIWLEENKPFRFFLTSRIKTQSERLCAYFGINEKSIRIVNA